MEIFASWTLLYAIKNTGLVIEVFRRKENRERKKEENRLGRRVGQ